MCCQCIYTHWEVNRANFYIFQPNLFYNKKKTYFRTIQNPKKKIVNKNRNKIIFQLDFNLFFFIRYESRRMSLGELRKWRRSKFRFFLAKNSFILFIISIKINYRFQQLKLQRKFMAQIPYSFFFFGNDLWYFWIEMNRIKELRMELMVKKK